MLKDVTHSGPRPMQHVNVLGWHATGNQKPHKLLCHNAHTVVDVQQGLVAHVEGPHELKDRNFQGKVEGGDEADGSIRPPNTF
jgi:hypothetical protein